VYFAPEKTFLAIDPQIWTRWFLDAIAGRWNANSRPLLAGARAQEHLPFGNAGSEKPKGPDRPVPRHPDTSWA